MVVLLASGLYICLDTLTVHIYLLVSFTAVFSSRCVFDIDVVHEPPQVLVVFCFGCVKLFPIPHS